MPEHALMLTPTWQEAVTAPFLSCFWSYTLSHVTFLYALPGQPFLFMKTNLSTFNCSIKVKWNRCAHKKLLRNWTWERIIPVLEPKPVSLQRCCALRLVLGSYLLCFSCESEEVCKWKLFIQNKFSDSVVSLQTMSYTSWSDHHSVSLLCPLPACICSATWIKEPISMKTTFSQCLNRLCDPALLMTWSSTCEKSAAATDSLTSWSLELRDTLELPEWRCGLSVFSFLTRMIERA